MPGTGSRAHRLSARATLYRWPKLDRWYIAGKAGIEEDFRQALLHDYRWQEEEPLDVAPAAPEEDAARPVALGDAPSVAPSAASSATSAVGAPNRPPSGAPPAVAAAVAETRTRRERRRQQAKPYAVEWLGEEFPARLLAGQILTVPVTIKNVGSLTWTWGGGNPVRLGYRYYRNRRPLPIPPTSDLRTDVPEDVAPGQTVVLDLHLALPEEPGNYTIELDFVQEGIAWFKEKGSKPLTRWLTVEAPTPDTQQADGRSSIQLPVRLFNDITTRLPRSGAPYARRNLNQIKYIVVNHTGAHPQLSLERIARTHIKRGYPGIAYDFVVDASGEILQDHRTGGRSPAGPGVVGAGRQYLFDRQLSPRPAAAAAA